MDKDLTSTSLDKAFGNTEYSVAGSFKDILEYDEDTNESIEIEKLEIVIKAENEVGFFEEILIMTNCTDQDESQIKALPVMVSDVSKINVVDRFV